MRSSEMWRHFVRIMMILYQLLLRLTAPIGLILKPRRKSGYDILLTGNFYSDNWIYAQLKPLSISEKVSRVRMVAEKELPTLDKVEAVYPNPRLSRLLGKDISRLLTFTWLSVSSKPDVIGGFHLLVNGLLAIMLARLSRARSLYVCGGGAREVAGGGYNCENKIFGRLQYADGFIEKQLIDAVSHADIVVTRGGNTSRYFLQKGAKSNFYFIPAGIDGEKYSPDKQSDDSVYDFIIVGRLTEIKRIDIYLQAIAITSHNKNNLKAAVVGDGPIRNELEKMAEKLDIELNVEFLGHRDDVEALLNKSRIFILTSDSEGLSQAMIQAMLCGLPAIVSNVGDLSELVENGVNGYLIDEQNPELFAKAMQELLDISKERFVEMSNAAREAALRCDIRSVAASWDRILEVHANQKVS